MPPRKRGWCYTLNNYTEEEEAKVQTIDAVYHIYGREHGKSGTPHLQGFVYFATLKSRSQVAAYLGGRAHLEPLRGTPSQAADYCRKDGDTFESGELPRQGKRSDLDEVREHLEAGEGMRHVVKLCRSASSLRVAAAWLTHHEPARRTKPNVTWYFGPTGCGKSRKVAAAIDTLNLDAYWHTGTKWFDGYDGEPVAVFDDFRAEQCKFAFLLRLLDRYPLRVEVKGGFRQWRPDHIYFTSPFPPEELFRGEASEDLRQLLRRIDTVERVRPDVDPDLHEDPADPVLGEPDHPGPPPFDPFSSLA